jgi:hypothetical protein
MRNTSIHVKRSLQIVLAPGYLFPEFENFPLVLSSNVSLESLPILHIFAVFP